MEIIDISKLSLEEIIELQNKITAALPDRKKQRLSEMQNSIKVQIEKAGFSLEEVLKPLLQNKGVKKASSGSRKPVPIKYRNGDDVWTGRGRVPGWITKFENDGGKRETLRV